MNRLLGCIALVCVLALIPGPAAAQGIVSSAVAWVTDEWGSPRITSEFRAGYRGVGYNFNVAITPEELLAPFLTPVLPLLSAPQFGSVLDLYPVDLKVENAHLAVGGLRLEGRLNRELRAFAGLAANIPGNVGIEDTQGPSIGGTAPESWHFVGSGFQWWQADAGMAYRWGPALSLLAGLRLDVTTVRMSDPSPVPGYTQVVFGTPVSFTFPNFSGDLQSSLTVPYVGVQVDGTYFKGSFLIGPASASLQLPIRLLHPGLYRLGIVGIFGRSDLAEEALYQFGKAGPYFAANLEGTAILASSFRVKWWVEGTWLSIRDANGQLDLSGQSSRSVLGLFTFQTDTFSASRSGDSTLTQYSYSIGVSSTLDF